MNFSTPAGSFSTGTHPTLEAIAANLPGGRVRGQFVRGGCPACGSSTGAWARVDDEGTPWVGCFACDDWRALRAALGLAADRTSRDTWLPVLRPRQPGDAPDMVEDADQLDAVYRVLLRHMPLSSDQRRNVLGRDRGLPVGLRNQLHPLVGPVPQDPGLRRDVHDRLVSELRTVAPLEFLRRVPELAARAADGLAVLPTRTRAQYFEPWCDEKGRIVALRAYMGRRQKPKYLTTAGRSGPLVHFAFGVPRERAGGVPWVLTEGWMKAEVLAHHLGCVGVAFAGVSQRRAWPRALDVLLELAPDAPVYVAYDAETWTTRPDLAVLALELARAVLDATGSASGFAVWGASVAADGSVTPKGIDDAIAAGIPVRLVEQSGFGAYLGPSLVKWEERRAA